MKAREAIELGDVQKTLLMPLWGRAMETQQRNPRLVDESAVEILARVEFDFSMLAQNIDTLTRIAWIQRSLVCDRVVAAFLARHPAGTVVNVGCGLDTTFERTDNGRMRWYDLDLPDVIALRRKFIRESARRTFLEASLLEAGWLQRIEVREGVLFIAAGVLYYFSEQDVRAFILRLLEAFPGSELLCDVSSPLGVRVANKKVVESAGLDERSHLVWGLVDRRELLSWDARLRLLATYYYFRRPGRIGVRNRLLGTLSDLLRIQYMLHLQLGARA